ncbi:MAG: hypothetical protein PHV74_02595 [Dehalococcoidia bacterium]|nr:hypothetical protein [Dehalococcoidia bacterium]
MQTWKPTTKRFVAYFDIMGFKEMVYRNGHNTVLDKMIKLRERVDLIENEARRLLNRQEDSGPRKKARRSMDVPILPVFFSDSILFVSQNDSKACARKILLSASWLLAASLIQGIPMKGSLAYGMQTADFEKSLHFGKPLTDAYLLEQEVGLYGAVLHNSMETYLKQNNMIDRPIRNHNIVVRYNIPLKKGNATHYCVNWLGMFDFLKQDPEPVVSALYDTVSGSIRSYVDNTVTFMRAVQSEQPCQTFIPGNIQEDPEN